MKPKFPLNMKVRSMILAKFERQSLFAPEVGMHTSDITHVLRGSRKISKQKAFEWSKALSCKLNDLESITR